MEFIDTHAHIYSDKFALDRDEVEERLIEASITEVYMPGLDHTHIEEMLAMEEKDPQRYRPMMGLHPSHVNKEFEKELYVIEDWLSKKTFWAIGEIGYDYYWDTTFKDEQAEAFEIQVNFAKDKQLPIAIHCRSAFEDNFRHLEKLHDDKLKGVWHCFSEGLEEAKKVIDLGFYLGINGIATFKNGGLDKVLPEIGLDHVVLETDCPYLAPAPFRGKRNEPSYIPYIAKRLAELTDKSTEEVAQITTANAKALFENTN